MNNLTSNENWFENQNDKNWQEEEEIKAALGQIPTADYKSSMNELLRYRRNEYVRQLEKIYVCNMFGGNGFVDLPIGSPRYVLPFAGHSEIEWEREKKTTRMSLKTRFFYFVPRKQALQFLFFLFCESIIRSDIRSWGDRLLPKLNYGTQWHPDPVVVLKSHKEIIDSTINELPDPLNTFEEVAILVRHTPPKVFNLYELENAAEALNYAGRELEISLTEYRHEVEKFKTVVENPHRDTQNLDAIEPHFPPKPKFKLVAGSQFRKQKDGGTPPLSMDYEERVNEGVKFIKELHGS